MTRVAALLAAAGAGTRLGLGPKAFVRLGDATLLEHAVAALAGSVDEIIVAVPRGAAQLARELVGSRAIVIEGAGTRQATVRALVAATSAETVLVHDAARPFLPRAVISRVLEGALRSGAASAALVMVDTVVDAETGGNVPRERLRAIQTPQGFKRELLQRAHARALEEGVEATDDAELVRRLGEPVLLVEGSPLLHKLTTPTDLALGEALLTLWRAREELAS